ncbi:MAG: hypothetical protein RL477_1626 [Pseudomonadota bacterium]
MRSAAVILAIVVLAAARPLAAGEADMEAGIHDPTLGPHYFGEARDVAGLKPLEDVRIGVRAKGALLPMFVETDHDGRFRLQGFARSIDPDTVQFTCGKEGYKVIALERRRIGKSPDAPTEVECLLERD